MDTNDGGRTTPEPEPKVIGLTGGIASGKSTVAQFLEEMDFPVYYSDKRAKEIVNENTVLKQEIIALLGENAYTEEGRYNRKWVSNLVFENQELLEKLNQIIHPQVKIDFKNWLNNQNKTLVFKETALLFELGLEVDCYKSLLVTSEDYQRMKRVMDRDGKTYREVEQIMDKQMPEKDKLRKADYIIYNNSTIEDLKQETELILSKIIDELPTEI